MFHLEKRSRNTLIIIIINRYVYLIHTFQLALCVHPGVIFTNGVEWKEQRTTSLEILRRLGMGKNVLADRIQEEVTHYIRAIQQHQGAPVDLRHLTQTSVSNNIVSIVFGKRFEHDDPDFKKYIHAMDDTMGSLTG